MLSDCLPNCCHCTRLATQLIPEEYEYNTLGDPSYVSSDETQKIQERTEVRLRIVGTKMDQTEIVSGDWG